MNIRIVNFVLRAERREEGLKAESFQKESFKQKRWRKQPFGGKELPFKASADFQGIAAP